MKFRLLDLLECSCGNGDLTPRNIETAKVAFKHELDKVMCNRFCAFKHSFIGQSEIRIKDCIDCYGQEIIKGTLQCVCGREYPIIRGIPRFLPEAMKADIEKTQKTFSYEWKMFRFDERNWGQDIEFRKNLFLQGMGAKPNDLQGKLILDAGCGSGILSIEMAKSFGMEVVALDLAYGVENAYHHNDNPFVHLIQGSVLELPFHERSFDYLYCAGVLVHLPDTKTGFLSIIPKLKHGGRCFIWVYHPIDSTYHPANRSKMIIYDSIRKYVTSRLPIHIQYYLYLSFISLFLVKQKIESLIGHRKYAYVTWREKMQNLFDSFSPIYVNRHKPEEIIDWYQKEGFSNVQLSDIGPFGFGIRGDIAWK